MQSKILFFCLAFLPLTVWPLEIETVDLSGLPPDQPEAIRAQPVDLPVPAAPAPSPVAAKETASPLVAENTQPTEEPPSVTVNEPPERKLEFSLRELRELKRAARAAGGDIRVTVLPVGITAEDMVAPLMQQGYFEVISTGRGIRVESRGEDPHLVSVRQEIQALEQRRRVLLEQIGTLEQRKHEQSVPAKDERPGQHRSKLIAESPYSEMEAFDNSTIITLSPLVPD